jgi:hypothetical protein
MGYKTEFNWVLKLNSEQGVPKKIELDKNYLFEKQEERVYPRGIPIDLVDQDWTPHARVIVEDIVISKNKTRGNFRVIYKYGSIEKKVLEKIIKKTMNYEDK